MDKRIPIFPVSYYKGKVENNDRLKGQLLPHINSKKDRLFVPEGWGTTKIITSIDGGGLTGDDSVNDFLYDSEELSKQYLEVLESFCDDNYVIEIDEIWFNYYINGEYQEQHNHLNGSSEPRIKGVFPSTFSGVHFLCYDKEVHSPLTFKDPMVLLRSNSFEFRSHNYDEGHKPDISEGDLIMFPSYLEHEVKAGKPTPGNPRVTISFNLKLFLLEEEE
tara:strand:- start:72 stop:728 length:657 start_codon:yes stop_codon:yes gene_type:complete